MAQEPLTLKQRIEWIFANRKRPDGKPWAAKPFAVACGLSEAHINHFVNERNKSAMPKTLHKIADTGEVSREWMLTGMGDPNAGTRHQLGAVLRSMEPVRQVPEPGDNDSPLEQALGHAFEAERHTLTDMVAVRTALRAGAHWQDVEGDMVGAARAWLDAAAGLRRDGTPVTPQAIAVRLTLGKRPMEHEKRTLAQRTDDLRQRLEADLRELGLEPGGARDLGRTLTDQLKKLLPRDS